MTRRVLHCNENGRAVWKSGSHLRPFVGRRPDRGIREAEISVGGPGVEGRGRGGRLIARRPRPATGKAPVKPNKGSPRAFRCSNRDSRPSNSQDNDPGEERRTRFRGHVCFQTRPVRLYYIDTKKKIYIQLKYASSEIIVFISKVEILIYAD